MTKLIACSSWGDDNGGLLGFLSSTLTSTLPTINQCIVFGFVVLFSLFKTANSAENAGAPTNAPIVIQSQVKGSQEQPNVIYVMPWQGVEQIIEVKGKERTIKLPTFSPIHPKAFKEQVRIYAKKQQVEKISKLNVGSD